MFIFWYLSRLVTQLLRGHDDWVMLFVFRINEILFILYNVGVFILIRTTCVVNHGLE